MTIPILSTLQLSLIYALITLGVYLTFRIINFADLTVDGTFPLGAALCALLITKGYPPICATLLASLAGMLAGSVTALLVTRLRIMGLLSGILTMTALYSINIRIMGRANIALLDVTTLFSYPHAELIVFGIILSIFIAIYYLLSSQFGLSMRSVGTNPKLSAAYGININYITLLTLALSNGLVALSGALFAQSQGFADVQLGNGIIIGGIASLILGEAILPSYKIAVALLAVLIGSILYRFAIAFALNSDLLGLQASDLNLMTTILIVTALSVPRFRHLFILPKKVFT